MAEESGGLSGKPLFNLSTNILKETYILTRVCWLFLSAKALLLFINCTVLNICYFFLVRNFFFDRQKKNIIKQKEAKARESLVACPCVYRKYT